MLEAEIIKTIPQTEGILLVDKPLHMTSFGVIAALRRLTHVKKIGHCGTLDPLASGLLVCLIGKNYTRLSDKFLTTHKTYLADVLLGQATTTYDQEGQKTDSSDYVPTFDEIKQSIEAFQGKTLQTPPIFSAKKVGGVKACEAARRGHTLILAPQEVEMQIDIVDFNYPLLKVKINCSKGTYIRSFAHDLGIKLSTYAHLCGLRRIQSGSFSIDQAISLENLQKNPEILFQHLNKVTYV